MNLPIDENDVLIIAGLATATAIAGLLDPRLIVLVAGMLVATIGLVRAS